MSEHINDGVVVSVDIRGKDNAVLVVGKPGMNGEMQIINAYEGQEARDLWAKLTIVKGAPRVV